MKRTVYEGTVVATALYRAECDGDEMSEEYVWSNADGLSQELRGVKGNWCSRELAGHP